MGLLSSILNAGVNTALTTQTNKYNYKIAQMNNQYNYKMFQEQQKYNWDMWNAENEYNSAVNQRKRLEEAGLNPYMMLDGGSAGTATSGNPVNPPRAHDVQMQAPQVAFESPLASISQAADVQRQLSQNELLGAQAEQYQIQNRFMASLLGSELMGRNLGNRKAALDVGFLGDTYQTRKRQLESELRLTDLQIRFQDLNNQWKELDVREKDKAVNTWYDHIQATTLRLMGEQMKSLVKGREVSDAQIKNLEATAYNAYRDALLKDAQTAKLVKENEAFANFFDEYCSAKAAEFIFNASYFGGVFNGVPKGQFIFGADQEGKRFRGPLMNTINGVSNMFEDAGSFIGSWFW